MDAAHAVRAARRRAGLSQRGLAARAGVSVRTVAGIEAGHASPTWKTVSALLSVAGLEPVADRSLPDPCSHLTRYLRYSTSERLYLSLGGTYHPQRDCRLAPWTQLGMLVRGRRLVLLAGSGAVGVWVPRLVDAPVAVRVPSVIDVPVEKLPSLRVESGARAPAGWVPVGVPFGRVLVPPPGELALDPACADDRLSLRAAARLLHEQLGRDEATRRAAAHRDPDEARERDRLAERRYPGKGSLDGPSRMTSRAWRLDGPVSLRQWMRDHQYPGVE